MSTYGWTQQQKRDYKKMLADSNKKQSRFTEKQWEKYHNLRLPAQDVYVETVNTQGVPDDYALAKSEQWRTNAAVTER